jgi:two-component system sensor histidine kinase AlgZ
LIFFAKLINKLKASRAILLIAILNIFCIYFVSSSVHKNFTVFFTDLDSSLEQIAVSFGILFFFLIYFDWREKNLDPANTMAKLMFLQAKMRPHFLFNTLNSIISLIKKEPETAKKMIFNLSELLRASIKEEVNFMYSLKEEIGLCEKYLEIEKIRLGNRLIVTWNTEEAVLTHRVPRLFLQPLIENSVLHGIQRLENGGTIEVHIHKNLGDRIIIEIKNPLGQSMNMLDEGQHNNISMENIKERLNLYYNGDIVFKAKSQENYYYVYIELPSIL